jgi:SAM-dependent methyltransferase
MSSTSSSTPSARSGFDLAEAFHLAQAVATLHEMDILDALAARPQTAKALAARHRLDPGVLGATLEYVAARTDILRRKGRAFAATPRYDVEARFLIDLYLGAFRPNAIRLRDVLRNARVGVAAVDRDRHARAFERAAGAGERPMAGVIRSLGLGCVLDLGCGAGDLLVQLAALDRGFTGVGIEQNPRLCRIARARVRGAGLGRRIRVVHGDARRLKALLPTGLRDRIAGVTACQVANEMFRSGGSAAVAWLRTIRRVLPGRPVVVNDYYGRLGTGSRGADRQTLLHDYVQVVSGQGVPPATRRGWQSIYRQAGYRLAHVIEDRATTQFIHVIV